MYKAVFILLSLVNKLLIFLKCPRLLALFFILYNFRKFIGRKNKKVLLNLKALTTQNEVDLLDNYNKKFIFVPLSIRLAKDVYNRFYFPYEKFRIFKKRPTPPREGLEEYNKRIELGNYNYWRNVDKYKNHKKKIIEFWKSFFEILKYFKFCDFIVSSNYVYAYLYDINESIKKLNISSISFCKETVHPFAYQENVIKNFYSKTKFNGDKIIFYSKKQKNLYIRLDGINSKNSFYIGSPKSDNLINFENQKRVKKEKYKAVLFFSADKDKLNGIPKKTVKKYQILEKTNNFYVQFLKFCELNKSDLFAIKLKKNNHYVQYFKPFLKKNNLRLPSNIKILNETSNSHHVINNSSKVFVYHSTVILESLILGKHVIEPEIYKKKLIDCKYFFTYGYDGVATRVSSLDTVKKAFQKKILIKIYVLKKDFR